MNLEFKEWLTNYFSFDNGHFYDDDVDKEYVENLADVIFHNGYNEITIGRKDYDYHYVSCKWNNSDGLNLVFGKSRYLFIHELHNIDGSIYNFTNASKIKIVIFDDTAIYYENKSGKLIPMSLKMLYQTQNGNPYLYDFFISYLTFLGQKFLIFKDILKWVQADKKCLLPLNFADLKNYHSLKDMFEANYKLASNLNYGWNKRDINLSYMILKSWTKVCPEDRNKLLQITSYSFDDRYRFVIKDNIKIFLFDYIIKNIGSTNDNDANIVKDYINMCFLLKEKVKIRFKSIKRYKEEHDKLVKTGYIKKTPVVKILTKTKFKGLRKILPPEFEWIKTRKRLIQETVEQNHCVWSYADEINKDKCQIYSYKNDNGNRYTLEFRMSRGKYICNQIKGFGNSEPPENLQQLVTELLKKQ